MKNTIAFLLCVLTVDGFSQEASSSERKPIDLIPFPNSGEFILGVDYVSTDTSTTDEINDTIEISSKKNHSFVQYAFNDFYSIKLEMDYLISSVITNHPVAWPSDQNLSSGP